MMKEKTPLKDNDRGRTASWEVEERDIKRNRGGKRSRERMGAPNLHTGSDSEVHCRDGGRSAAGEETGTVGPEGRRGRTG